jgi:hypothetical protein
MAGDSFLEVGAKGVVRECGKKRFVAGLVAQAALEVADALAEALTEVGNLAGAEQQNDDQTDDTKLWKSEAHGILLSMV